MDHKYYRPTTTDAIMKHLKINESRVFWIRIDTAIVYLKDKYGEEAMFIIRKYPEFWKWWLRIWETLDKKFLNAAGVSRVGLHLKDYFYFQYYTSLSFEMDHKQVKKYFFNHKTQSNVKS